MKSLVYSLIFAALAYSAANAEPLVYEGGSGIGKGKHIVLLAGDHEYRSEESLPAFARIMARHHGFKKLAPAIVTRLSKVEIFTNEPTTRLDFERLAARP